MATGVPSEKVTRFPNGIGQFTFIGAGAAAGNQTVTGIVKSRDSLVQVTRLVLSGTVVTAFGDYTNEFTISADNQINNTGKTSMAGGILFVTVSRDKPA